MCLLIQLEAGVHSSLRVVSRLEKLGARLASQFVRGSLTSKRITVIILLGNTVHQRELSRLVIPKWRHLNHIILVDHFENIELLQSLLFLIMQGYNFLLLLHLLLNYLYQRICILLEVILFV